MVTRRELFPMALAPLAASLAPGLVPAAFGQAVPRVADELLVTTMLGSKIDLKSMRGKVCAVELLLTWCSHCQASARVLQDLYTELKPKGFEVIGAATNTDVVKAKEDIGGFMGITNAKFPIGWITQDQAMRFLQHPAGKNLYFPQLVLLDRKGRVVYQHEGEADAGALRAEIMAALEGRSTTASPAKSLAPEAAPAARKSGTATPATKGKKT